MISWWYNYIIIVVREKRGSYEYAINSTRSYYSSTSIAMDSIISDTASSDRRIKHIHTSKFKIQTKVNKGYICYEYHTVSLEADLRHTTERAVVDDTRVWQSGNSATTTVDTRVKRDCWACGKKKPGVTNSAERYLLVFPMYIKCMFSSIRT